MTLASSAFNVKFNPLDMQLLSDPHELEKLILFGICVDGRTARAVWPKVEKLLGLLEGSSEYSEVMGPFELLNMLTDETLTALLQKVKMGQYTRIVGALRGLGRFTNCSWTAHRLAELPGVGLKTAKFAELYKYPGGNCAVLDVHVLRAMAAWPIVKSLGLKVPAASPSNPHVYQILEAVFLGEAERRHMPAWQFDKWLWEAARLKGEKSTLVA